MEKTTDFSIKSYLTFRLENEVFALNVRNVVNILEMCKITRIPNMPHFVEGVINLRGEVLPVIDTRLKFGMSATEVTKSTCILVLEIHDAQNTTRMGVLVDEVKEVLEIDKDIIKLPPQITKKYNNDFIIGMIEVDDSFIMLLDIDKILTADEMVSLMNTANE